MVASVDYAAATFASALFNLWGIDLGVITFADGAALDEIFAVFVVILILHALINIYSSHLVALFNNISVFVHVVGVIVIIAILAFVPDRHQDFDFVFTETLNNSGFSDGSGSSLFFWFYVLPLGFLLDDVHGNRLRRLGARARRRPSKQSSRPPRASGSRSSTRRSSAGSCCSRSRSRRSDVDAASGGAIPIFTSAMSEGWAEIVILISTIGQIFCGMACVTSCSRTFFAFSRDRAVPGWKIWSAVDKNRVPRNAVLAVCALAGIITLPALTSNEAGIPIAFFAVVSVAVIGLYIAYVIPVYLRWRAGSNFQPGVLDARREVPVGERRSRWCGWRYRP